jgi:hypothetical protein
MKLENIIKIDINKMNIHIDIYEIFGYTYSGVCSLSKSKRCRRDFL